MFDGDPQPQIGSAALGKRLMKASKPVWSRHDKFLLLWQTLSEIFYPERADFTTDFDDALDRYEGLYSAEPQLLRGNLERSLGATMRPRATDWFKARISDDDINSDIEVERWTEKITKTTRNIIYHADSNFTKAHAEADADYVTFGNSVMTRMYRSDNRPGIVFKCLHLRDVAWSINEFGHPGTIYRRWKDTIENIAKVIDVKRMPKEWRDAHKNTPHMMKTVMCILSPLSDFEPGELENVPMGSMFVCHYLCDGLIGAASENPIIDQEFFKVGPFVIRRWMTVSGEPYGRSPCSTVSLGDSETLNKVQQTLLTAVERRVRPPLWVRNEAVAGGERGLRLEPNGINFVSDEAIAPNGRMVDPITPLEIGDPSFGFTLSENVIFAMRRAWFEDLFALPNKDNMTAYEVRKHIERQIQEASPLFEPMEADNALMMDGVTSMAMARGAYGPVDEMGHVIDVPEKLKDADRAEIEYEFTTPLTQAREELEGARYQEMLAAYGGLIQLQTPEAIAAADNYNLDVATREAGRAKFSAKWMLSEDEVKQKRLERQQQQEAAQAQESAIQAADIGLNANPENLRRAQEALGGT